MALICSSSHSSSSKGKSLQSSLICPIIFFNLFALFQKHLQIIILIFFKRRMHANYCLTSMIRVHLRNLFIIKICNFITMEFYFGLQKFVIIDRLVINLFFCISADFIPNSILSILFLVFYIPKSPNSIFFK